MIPNDNELSNNHQSSTYDIMSSEMNLGYQSNTHGVQEEQFQLEGSEGGEA